MPGLLRLPAVKSKTGLSKTEIYRREKRGDFPARRKLSSRVTVWAEAEIDAWVAAVLGYPSDLSEILG